MNECVEPTFASQIQKFQKLFEAGEIDESEFQLLVSNLGTSRDVTSQSKVRSENSSDPNSINASRVQVSFSFGRRRLLVPSLLISATFMTVALVIFGLTGYSAEVYGGTENCDGALFELSKTVENPNFRSSYVPSGNVLTDSFYGEQFKKNLCRENAIDRLKKLGVVGVIFVSLTGFAGAHDRIRFGRWLRNGSRK